MTILPGYIYLALGVLPDGTRDILGMWIENTEGAKFWMKVFNDLKTPRRGRHPDRRHRRPQGHAPSRRRPWGQGFPTVVSAWRRAWDRVIPFFAFPPAVRRVIYTANVIESINARLRKIIKTRGHFPSDDAQAMTHASMLSMP